MHGKQILVQHNPRTLLLPDGGVQSPRKGGSGTGLFVLDADGGNRRELAAGPPHTAPCTDHECFVGDTDRVAFSAAWTAVDDYQWTQVPAHPQGNLFTVAPGDAAPTVFPAPQFLFNHLSVSRCGRYFVADAVQGGLFRDGRLQPVCLVVGNLQTGKYRVLVSEPLCYAGGNQCTHPHPYLTADNGRVIFNANPGFLDPSGLRRTDSAGIPGESDMTPRRRDHSLRRSGRSGHPSLHGVHAIPIGGGPSRRSGHLGNSE